MAERTGTCSGCKGVGEIRRRDPVLLRTEIIPCGLCNGEGFSGDAMEQYQEDLRAEHEQELKEIGYARL